MNKFAKHVLSVAVAGAFSGITLSALAETDAEQNINDQSSVLSSDETIEEVVAVGVIFEGQAKALDTQRNSDRILNVISADGIGKLPDRNAAEAVQRLPGVSIERDQGEGRFVAVRGLPAQWSSASMNGDRIPTAEEETTSRATAFDFFPTEMIQSIEVSKALTPDMEGDAIGGNVNFITRMAPEDTLLDVTVGTNYSDKAGKAGYNLNIMAGDRSEDGKFGYIINATTNFRHWATDNFEPRRNDDGSIYRLELRDYTGERDTRGLNGAVEYNFDNGDSIYARTLYGTLIDDETHYKHRYRFDKQTQNPDGSIDGGRVELQHIHNILTTELTANEIGGEHFVGTDSKLDWKLATYDNHFYYGDVPNSSDNSYFVAKFTQKDVVFDGLQYDEDGEGRSNNFIDGGSSSPTRPSTHLQDGFQMDPSQMKLADIELYKVDVREKDKIVAQLDFTHDMSYDLQLKTGMKYRQKERIARFSDEFYTLKAGEADVLLSDFNLRNQPGRSDFLNDINAKYDQDFSQVASMSDVEDFWTDNRDKFELDNGESATVENGGALSRNFDVEETHMAAYGMATYHLNDETKMVGGLRIEQTDTQVDGYLSVDGVTTPRKENKKYTSVLPSLHVTHALAEEQNLRFALTRSFARPDFGALTPGGSYSEADGTLQSGNPDLDPTYSDNLDVMFEQYFGNVGIVSAGAFYKHITDPIFRERGTGEFRGQSVKTVREENGDTAWLGGVEFALSRRLDFLLDDLYNFGVQANYTRMRSVMELPDGRKAPITRQADELYNASVFYDDNKFAVRLAVNHKGDYILEHGSSSDFDEIYGGNTSVDFSASYTHSDDLMFYFDANNITNEPLKYYLGNKNRPTQTEYYGYRMSAGVKYSFF